MTSLDLTYLAVFAMSVLLDYFVVWPAFVRRSRADSGRARSWLWSNWVIQLWVLVGGGVALWLFTARAWGPLGLTVPHGWRLWGAFGLVTSLAIMYSRRILKLVEMTRGKRVKIGNDSVAQLAPHNRSELARWVMLSLSAGICEEFLYRGYLIWALQPLVGLWGAAALSLAVFAAAHAYQGTKGVLPTVILGAFFTAAVLVFNSLLPAMALHALVDVANGLVAWVVLRNAQGGGNAVAGLGAPAPSLG